MKKYLFGTITLALAIALSAFTKPKSNFSSAYFEFVGLATSSEPLYATECDIQNLGNWEYISVESGCDLGNEEDYVCVIRLDDQYYDNSPVPQINKSNFLPFGEFKPNIVAKVSDLDPLVFVVDAVQSDVLWVGSDTGVFNIDVD